jgi:hypothetical protein
MLERMNELNEVWARMIAEAQTKAQASGRGDVAEYLALKASNDAFRAASVKRLFDSALEIAAQSNRENSSIQFENETPHNFAFANANLVGSLARFRQGVRCLSVEAGWTRTPADGFMRGGALACARISHFGMSKANAELLLIRAENSPNWFQSDKNGKRHLFDSKNLQQHFQMFLGTA